MSDDDDTKMAKLKMRYMEMVVFRHLVCAISRDVTEIESECCRTPTIFCKSEIRQIFKLIWIWIQLLFWKTHGHHLLQSAINNTH